MPVGDDLRKLAAEDVAYLTYRTSYTLAAPTAAVPTGVIVTPAVVYRGRLRQAINGDWVFITSIGQNGVVAIVLGPAQDPWMSTEAPFSGLQVMAQAGTPPFEWDATISTLEPADLST